MNKTIKAALIILVIFLLMLGLDTFLRHVTDYDSSEMKGITALVILIVMGPIAFVWEKNWYKIWKWLIHRR